MRARSQDFAQYVPYHVTKSSHHLGWRGFRGEIVRGHSAGEITLPPLDHHLLNLIVSVPTLHEHRWGGVQREEVGREGAASLVPAGHQSYWRWSYVEEGVPCDFHLHLDPAFVRRIAVVNLDDLPQDVEFRANLCFYNPALRVLAQLLLEEVEHDGAHGSLYAESLTTSLVALLLKSQRSWPKSQAPPPRSHGRHRLHLVCEYIDANLGAHLHLEQLGAIVSLGPDRFGEVFRAALGVSPYRYVLQRKLDRAKAMLSKEKLSITEIAVHLGFADHAHFSATFRRATGLTPSRFRTESRR